MFGEFNPGQGFVVGRSKYGEPDLSDYMAVRYLNQLPPNQSARDHLSRPIPIQPRDDFQFHRVMLFFQGRLFGQKFRYQAFVWTVQDTNEVAVGPPTDTTLRLADSLNIFDTGALANGVTVKSTHYSMISAAAGMKYRAVNSALCQMVGYEDPVDVQPLLVIGFGISIGFGYPLHINLPHVG
jgi:hypothetical protein